MSSISSPFNRFVMRHAEALVPAANLAVNLATPIILDISYRQQNIPTQQRKLLVHQEWIRQLVSGAFGQGCYGIGNRLSKVFLKTTDKELQRTMGIFWGTVASAVGYGLFRPYLTAFLSSKTIPGLKQLPLIPAKAESQSVVPAFSGMPGVTPWQQPAVPNAPRTFLA